MTAVEIFKWHLENEMPLNGLSGTPAGDQVGMIEYTLDSTIEVKSMGTPKIDADAKKADEIETLDPNVPTFPELLQQVGYCTALFGKASWPGPAPRSPNCRRISPLTDNTITLPAVGQGNRKLPSSSRWRSVAAWAAGGSATVFSSAPVGDNTKIILTGDPYQIDNPYVDSSNNGLTTVVQRFMEQNIAGHITLVKGERSELAELAATML